MQLYTILTLPMRNWNAALAAFFCSVVVIILTLPMRNWNYNIVYYVLYVFLYFDSTYEELKLLEVTRAVRLTLFILTLPMRNWNSGYRPFPDEHSRLILTLPMRNWNKYSGVPFGKTTQILTLPMRNWNSTNLRGSSFVTPFWLYLWGIETLLKYLLQKTCSPFWLYLWGIETLLL